jgi:hypothetical protein
MTFEFGGKAALVLVLGDGQPQELHLHAVECDLKGVLAQDPRREADRTRPVGTLDPHGVPGVARDDVLGSGEPRLARLKQTAASVVCQDDIRLGVRRKLAKLS